MRQPFEPGRHKDVGALSGREVFFIFSTDSIMHALLHVVLSLLISYFFSFHLLKYFGGSVWLSHRKEN